MKYGSLFSGIGGFDLGLEHVGMECAWQVEIDKHCQKLLEDKFPNAKRYTDVRTVGRANLESVDLICGGFPCQDVSVAGKRAGLAGERSGLWNEFARIIDELEPKWVVVENVPGLLSSNRGRDFAVIIQWLVKRGYGVCWRVLDAQYFGVAQRRRRVFIVASLGSGSSAQVLFEREGVSRDSAPSRQAREGVAGTLKGGTGGRGYPDPSDGNGGGLTLSPTLGKESYSLTKSSSGQMIDFCIPTVGALQARDYKGVGSQFVDEGKVIVDTGTFEEWYEKTKEFGGNREEWERLQERKVIAYKVDNTHSNGHGIIEDGTTHTLGGSTDVVAFDWQSGSKSKRTQIARTGGDYAQVKSSTVDAVAFQSRYFTRDNKTGNADSVDGNIVPPLRASSQNGDSETNIASPLFGVRRLTPTECERLQGFPDGWTSGFSDSTRYKMLGNAVAVPCAEWIARRILTIDTTRQAGVY